LDAIRQHCSRIQVWACRICYGLTVPAGRKPTLTRDEFVVAAIRFADEFGLAALSLRELGRAMGVSPTAVYRYFQDKDDLIVQIRETLLAQVLDSDPTRIPPREFIVATALAYRRMAKFHPCFSQVMVIAVTEGDAAQATPELLTRALEALGLQGDAVIRGYRQLESCVVGMSYFDFANAPHHLQERLDRMRRVDRQDFQSAFGDPDDVERINEEAFEATIRMLLDALVAQAGTPT
jgi:AcrR family transcriptional regulator